MTPTPSASPRGGRATLVAVVLLVALGLAVNVWRPTAPALVGPPTDLAAFDTALLARIAEYRRPQRLVALLSLFLSAAIPVAAVLVPAVRARLVALAAGRRPAVRASLVVVVVLLVADLATLPLDVWVGWIHEREWGFATGGLPLWLRDRLVSLVLRSGTAAVGAALLWWLATRAPATWQRWLVLGATGAAALLVLVNPLVVQPLFLRTQPLAAGPVHDAVTEVLVAAGEPELGIEVGDASRRTSRVNAFVTGLGPSRRVVLYDTLLELPPEHVAYVVAHELAHREHRDLPRGVLLTPVAALPVAWLLRRLWDHRALAADRAASGGDARLLPVVGLAVLVALTLVGAPVANALSRRAEAAADHGALELTGAADVQVAVNRVFVTRDLADPTPPAWVTALWGSHPSVSRRIQAAVEYADRHDLPLPVPAPGA